MEVGHDQMAWSRFSLQLQLRAGHMPLCTPRWASCHLPQRATSARPCASHSWAGLLPLHPAVGNHIPLCSPRWASCLLPQRAASTRPMCLSFVGGLLPLHPVVIRAGPVRVPICLLSCTSACHVLLPQVCDQSRCFPHIRIHRLSPRGAVYPRTLPLAT